MEGHRGIFLKPVLVLLSKNKRSVEFESLTQMSAFKSHNILNDDCCGKFKGDYEYEIITND